MDYYGAGADIARMKADADNESIARDSCLMWRFHNGIVGELFPKTKHGYNIDPWEVNPCECFPCLGCTDIDNIQTCPPELVKSMEFIQLQELQYLIEEGEQRYQEFMRSQYQHDIVTLGIDEEDRTTYKWELELGGCQ